MARISARRTNVHVPPLHIEEARSGMLKMVPGISVRKLYVMLTWFKTNVGASGSASNGGFTDAAATAEQPELSQLLQFAFCDVPVPFTPEPLLMIIGLHICSVAPVGFHRAPVMS